VSGKVLFEGKPAGGATVTFVPEGLPQSGKENISPSGVTDEDGNFQLSYGDKGLGAPAGKYAVMVVWRKYGPSSETSGTTPTFKSKRTKKEESRDEKRDRKLAPDLLKGRYSDVSKPLLRAEVKSETNHLPPFELVDGPAPAPVPEKKARRPVGDFMQDNG
jgi:hypothetical protein